MNLLWVAGGRDFTDRELIRSTLIPYHDMVLVTGAARGCDLIAEQEWRSMQRPYLGVPARWSMYQKSAGPKRNEQIATWEANPPKLLLAFPGGRGTADAIYKARYYRIEVREIGRVPA